MRKRPRETSAIGRNKMKQGRWLIEPFERGHSGTFDCNLLWQSENVYVMDNHRLALWCWMQHIEEEQYDIVHIDEHYDCLSFCHDSWSKEYPKNLKELSLDAYMSYPWKDLEKVSKF